MKKAGYVAVIGRTNVGKSTLVNLLIGQKINIVSHKQQTTRTNILGIITEKNNQIIFIDTPGIHRSKNVLDKFMNRSIKSAREGADIVLYLVDATKEISAEEFNYLGKLTEKTFVLIVVNKIDIAKEEKMMAEVLKLNNLKNCEIIPISAKKNKNIDRLKEIIVKNLPDVDVFPFEDDDITDKSIAFLCEEIVREKVLLFTNQEIPHGVMCKVISFKEKKNITEIDIDIICEKQSHKGIIIGKQGRSLKRIGSSARIDMEKLLKKKVMLKLFVKVIDDWRNKEKYFKS